MREPEWFIPSSTPPEVRGLREDVSAPDLSDSILNSVDRKRGWLNRRQRRLVCGVRWLGGFALVATLAGVLIVQRTTPIDDVIAPRERPLANLMQNVRDETSVAVQNVSTQMRSLPEQIVNRSQLMVTGRIERMGNRRVVHLDGPVSVVEEGHVGQQMMLDWVGPDDPVVARATQHQGMSLTVDWTDGRYRTLPVGEWSIIPAASEQGVENETEDGNR